MREYSSARRPVILSYYWNLVSLWAQGDLWQLVGPLSGRCPLKLHRSLPWYLRCHQQPSFIPFKRGPTSQVELGHCWFEHTKSVYWGNQNDWLFSTLCSVCVMFLLWGICAHVGVCAASCACVYMCMWRPEDSSRLCSSCGVKLLFRDGLSRWPVTH